MWTRKDMKDFKENIGKCKENVIKIGSLGTATVSLMLAGWSPVITTLAECNTTKQHYKAVASQTN